MIADVYAKDRKSDRAQAYPGDIACILQIDGFGGYAALAKRQKRITRVFCWLHVRRKFFDLVGRSPVSTEVLQRIAGIYAIESEVRGTDADHRRLVRNQHARVIV